MLNNLISDVRVYAIYVYGSRVYGRYTELSDYDYVVIVNEDYPYVENIEDGDSHFNFYTETTWEDMIKTNHIVALECCFLDEQYKIKDLKNYKLTIDKIELRKSISKVCSNSYDKCRKKLTIEKDFSPYIAKKSLWHSIRILMFGIQCYEYGMIKDYSEANKYYDDIV